MNLQFQIAYFLLLFWTIFSIGNTLTTRAKLQPLVAHDNNNTNTITLTKTKHSYSEIPYDEIEQLPLYQDIAHTGSSVDKNTASPIDMLMQGNPSDAIFEIDFSNPQVVTISIYTYYGLILGVMMLLMITVFYICSKVKSRIMSTNRFAYLKMTEK